MAFRNIFTVYLKRIFTKKLYISILVLLLAFTALYKCLPDKEKSADIKVGIYIEDSSVHAEKLKKELANISSVYTFYIADSEGELTDNIKSGHSECGFVIPDGFFDSYIEGNAGANNVILYTVPGTTLSETISETLFSQIYKICAGDILHYAINLSEPNPALDELFISYAEGDEIFHISDNIKGTYTAQAESFAIDIPIYELSLILIIFAGLLGLLTFMTDSERNIFIALSDKDKILILASGILAAVLPVYFLSIVTCAITYGIKAKLAALSLCMLAVFFASVLLNPVIRKSTVLTKVLPVIMLCAIVVIFVKRIL